MDFAFLPKLPKSNLDDRTYQELVDECILRIPRYCPEWTNHNPSDPGITLIELFAWLTDQMLLRFNQVPRRNYVTFLEMLGLRLQPPVPARTQVTFYLTASLDTLYTIPGGTEVATERTEQDEAVIFSTDHPLTLGVPRIRHCLSVDVDYNNPETFQDRFANFWNQEADGRWVGREQPIFQLTPQIGNCFYLVFDADEPLDGNVIALNIEGEAAGSTGINPDHPPRRWEAWDGMVWRPILLRESDDGTRGFSFEDPNQTQEIAGVKSADVVLHLPLNWPATTFASYQGRWLRCRYLQPEDNQSGYSRSPQVVGLSARTLGGTTTGSQCTLIRDELLGESDGTPGQRFQLQSASILPRLEGEHLLVMPAVGLPQVWQEVNDFSESGPQDLHYTLDSVTGEIQFGPLIREPSQIQRQIQQRRQQQMDGQAPTPGEVEAAENLSSQHGKVPPRGAMLRMAAYRTGGGQRGNVQQGTLQILKSAVPYVARVINHQPAVDGADAETLEEAVIRVPRLLRTRDRAVTPEDFEALTLQSSPAVVRAFCPSNPLLQSEPGVVKILVVPEADTHQLGRDGLPPERLRLTDTLRREINNFLDDRRLLGIEVNLQEPAYMGVAVQAEVALEAQYSHPEAQQEIAQTLERKLYQFLNPLVGGFDGQGWPLGAPVYKSDIISLFQQTTGVRYLGAVLLFELRSQGTRWVRNLAPNETVDPGPLGMVCSWADRRLRSGHTISFI